jgi:hypothetical protein
VVRPRTWTGTGNPSPISAIISDLGDFLAIVGDISAILAIVSDFSDSQRFWR